MYTFFHFFPPMCFYIPLTLRVSLPFYFFHPLNGRNSVKLTNIVTQEDNNSEVKNGIGQKIKKFNYKVSFEIFKDKISNYVISIYKNGGNMKPIFKKLEDSINAMVTKHKPMPFTNTVDEIEKEIQRERIT